jgi:hypothetical protein
MRQILYAMHFKGRASRALPDPQSLRTIGTATSCVVSTLIRGSDVETSLRASEGDLAFLDSELTVTGPDSYREDGTITFGDDANSNVLRFSTLGDGHFATNIAPGTMAGSASWKVEGGAGRFAAARGFISSNFTINDAGELSDFQCGLIFVPEELSG